MNYNPQRRMERKDYAYRGDCITWILYIPHPAIVTAVKPSHVYSVTLCH